MPDSKLPKINWAKLEEAENFAKNVKLYRQGKIDKDNFRRFRLQHGVITIFTASLNTGFSRSQSAIVGENE